ncbi:MAG: chemotaxis protein CheD [bacterium]
MKEVIKVGMADIKVSVSPNVLTTLGLGSCLGIILYDPVKKVGAMAHTMLPDINMVKIQRNKAKFSNSAITEMIQKMIKLGAHSKNLEAKIIGGAHMFTGAKIINTTAFNVGERNILSAREALEQQKIKIVGEDVGGDYGRSVEFNLDTGKVKIRTIAWGLKEI